ncbi:MAG: hypothetical protein A3C90_00285 [Candidatus Magasanikbacteria bacterium RIFCSPHIGHO2_02_FULL_51_14]|uniref:HpcH/HpaI aldolase/citrate lyase domain-containing protein n=1 Tax=Candidatus Magasanikbacteria bacterium RIFCSPHIGHO2_02_FULL_51_14 TaxID=1798683 RepID=A0A1F6MD44_9BACT|nr:MAG: hypothetical protein A3C90_00285 [Candidatus Magasanikbacteria bacterium RIFCSPHIGHO2_02_FULL_51_14]
MVDSLADLRENFGAVGVKAEFEAEGTRLNELIRLKDIVSRAGLTLMVKIGGPEAVRDILDALIVGVSGIVAPMVESAYALKKYFLALEKYIPADVLGEMVCAANVETRQAYQNFGEMLGHPKIDLLDFATIGRVDLSGSMGLNREEINSEQMFHITKDICEMARKANIKTAMGGGISKQAIPFIGRLVNDRLLDRFETRKIIFSAPQAINNADVSLIKANQFELLWLQNKADYYTVISREDKERIGMLQTRSTL